MHNNSSHGSLTVEKTIETLRGELSAAQRLVEEYRVLLYTDALTNMPNRRFFDTLLDKALAESERYNIPVSLVMCDVDHFKKVNDIHGHEAGDRVLQLVGSILCQGRRVEDTIAQIDTKNMPSELNQAPATARYGGEEFMMILVGCSLENAVVIAQELRQTIQLSSIDVSDIHTKNGVTSLNVTASFGVTTFDPQTEKKSALMSRLDRALYSAKDGGRNIVCYAEEPTTEFQFVPRESVLIRGNNSRLPYLGVA